MHAGKPDQHQKSRAAKPHHQCGNLLPAQILHVLLPVCPGKQHGKTGAAADQSKEKQIHDRAGDTNGSKLRLPREAADDKGINGIVELLQNVAEYQRQGQSYQMPRNISLCEILCILCRHCLSLLFLRVCIDKSITPAYP